MFLASPFCFILCFYLTQDCLAEHFISRHLNLLTYSKADPIPSLGPVTVNMLVTQSCRLFATAWTVARMDCSPPGSSVHGILQARILEWVAVPFSRGLTQGSNPGLLHCRRILYHLSHEGSPYIYIYQLFYDGH